MNLYPSLMILFGIHSLNRIIQKIQKAFCYVIIIPFDKNLIIRAIEIKNNMRMIGTAFFQSFFYALHQIDWLKINPDAP